MAAHAKSFNHKSGLYLVQLFVSDPLISNPIAVDLANVNFKFGEQQQKASSKAKLYATKPEIKHMFRVAEKRPSLFVSNVFSVLCLLPSVLLIVLVSGFKSLKPPRRIE
jgi:oligosaccharyltransferase complex subunit delta (ribophorin II)